jgi:hypothetical protein
MNSTVLLCFLDASKAFDRVNHFTLFNKLRDRGVPGYIVRIIAFWYSHQQMCVRWSSVTSNLFSVSNGVRQGGILSPYLFNVYIDDLSCKLNVQPIGCYVGIVVVNHSMYADDVVLIAPSAAWLKKLIFLCEQFGTEHDVLYNSKKSFTMLVRSSLLKDTKIPPFKLNNMFINDTTCTKYLGHFIHSSFSDNRDISRQTHLLYTQGNTLLRKFHMCYLNVKCTLFKTYCSSLYTAHIWWNYSKTVMNKICIAYHNVMKMVLGLSKYESTSLVCSIFNIQSFSSVVRNLIFLLHETPAILPQYDSMCHRILVTFLHISFVSLLV